jgi:hypothetical protein
VQCLVSLPDGLAGYTFPFYNTLAVQKLPAALTEPVHAPGSLDPTALSETEPAQAGPQTVHAMRNAGWPALLAAHSFLLTTNLSDSIFGGRPTVGTLQTLARAARRLALPTHVMRSSLPSHSHHASSPRSMNVEPQQASSHLKGSRLVWLEVAEVPPHHNYRDLARAISHDYGRSSLPRFS